jgi:outer membrane receptor protein involved in Fe transport
MSQIKSRSKSLLAVAIAGVISGAVTESAVAQAPVAGLEEITVTATRQEVSVNRVAMSISALSQDKLTTQGIRVGADLARLVPGVTFAEAGGDRKPSFTIRGIGGSSVGSETTGFYLDDTALQRRMINGLQTGNGAPFPNLYDIERVEVLRGPQGTLYGDSSEGGTIRFITPTPSLTEYSGRTRVDTSTTEDGAPSGELGVALGGPIMEDVLGFRVSGNFRRQGGWLDSKSVYDGLTFSEDNNWSESSYTRASALWQITDTLSVTPALYWGRDQSNDDTNAWGPSEKIAWSGSVLRNGIPNVYNSITNPTGINYAKYGPNSLPVVGFTSSNRPTTSGNYAARIGQLGYVDGNGNPVTYYYSAADKEIPAHTQNAMPWYNFDSNGNGFYSSTKPGDVEYYASPRNSRLLLPSLTIEKDFDSFSVKSITSYIDDATKGQTFSGGTGGGTRNLGTYIWGTTSCVDGINRLRPGLNPKDAEGCYRGIRYVDGFPQSADWYNYENQREGLTEELRFTSSTSGPLTWVGGAYTNNSEIHMHGRETSNEDAAARQLSGISGVWRGGGYFLPQWGVNSPAGVGPFDTWQQDVSDREVWLKERTWAVFAEGNYELTDKLTLTLGARYNKYKQDFKQLYGALVAGFPPRITIAALKDDGFLPNAAAVQAVSQDPTKPNSKTNPVLNLTSPAVLATLFPTDLAGCPDSPNCGLQSTKLESKEKNVTPKVALAYELTDTNMAYAMYSEGFRPGGVNPPVPSSGQCQQALADLGLTQSPLTYEQDTVESYEIGNKVRILDGRVQLNSALFYIDWKEMQYSQAVACGFSYLNNAGSAVSKGAELQANGRFGNFAFTVNVSYNQAAYAETILSNPSNPASAVVRKAGDNIGGVPDWTFSFSPQYDLTIAGNDAFIRFDYSFSDSYRSGLLAELDKFSAGNATNTYNPWAWITPSTYNMNLRAGINVSGIDWAFYVSNLTDKQPLRRLPGSSSTGDGAYINGTMARPRTIGFQLNYEF